MRKATSILLVTFLLANIAGFYIYFYFRLQEIRKEMHAEIARTSPELLKRISFSRADYMIVKEGDDEVEWNGIMYDIASIEFIEDRVEILALADEAETNLLSLLSKITLATSKDTKTPPPVLMQYLSLTCTLPSATEPSCFTRAIIIRHNTQYFFRNSVLHRRITAPPPRA